MKNLMLFLLGVFVSHFAVSQSGDGNNFRFGITAKPAFPTWFKAETTKKDAIQNAANDGISIGFSYGLFSEYQFADNYSVEIDINHLLYQANYKLSHSQGKKEQLSDTTIDPNRLLKSRQWNLQYLEIPISVRMKTNEIGYFTYFAKVGIAPAVNLKSRGTNTVLNSDNQGGIKEKDVPIDDASLFNASIIIGGGAMYSLGGNTYLNGGLTFHNGLVNIQSNANDYSIKTAHISLDMGILF